MTPRAIREFGILQIAPNDPLDCRVSVVESERRLGWLFPIWETMTCKVDPFVLANFNRREFAPARSFYLADGNEMFLFSTRMRRLARMRAVRVGA